MNRLLTLARDEKEVAELLSVLLTPGEYDEIAGRWQILQQLLEGKTQREVSKSLKVAIATVTRGARELKQGGEIFRKFHERIRRKHGTRES